MMTLSELLLLSTRIFWPSHERQIIEERLEEVAPPGIQNTLERAKCNKMTYGGGRPQLLS